MPSIDLENRPALKKRRVATPPVENKTKSVEKDSFKSLSLNGTSPTGSPMGDALAEKELAPSLEKVVEKKRRITTSFNDDPIETQAGDSSGRVSPENQPVVPGAFDDGLTSPDSSLLSDLTPDELEALKARREQRLELEAERERELAALEAEEKAALERVESDLARDNAEESNYQTSPPGLVRNEQSEVASESTVGFEPPLDLPPQLPDQSERSNYSSPESPSGNPGDGNPRSFRDAPDGFITSNEDEDEGGKRVEPVKNEWQFKRFLVNAQRRPGSLFADQYIEDIALLDLKTREELNVLDSFGRAAVSTSVILKGRLGLKKSMALDALLETTKNWAGGKKSKNGSMLNAVTQTTNKQKIEQDVRTQTLNEGSKPGLGPSSFTNQPSVFKSPTNP